MKNVVLVPLIILTIAVIGCLGEEKRETPTLAETPTPVPTETYKESKEGYNKQPETKINTLLDLFNMKKMYHGTAKITVEGKTEMYEFWGYYDANSKEQKVRMESNEGAFIIIQKYENNALITTMYMKNYQNMQMPEGCDWVELKSVQTVSPSELSKVEDKPVKDSFKDVIAQQGQIEEEYSIEFIDYDPQIFKPDGSICSMEMFSHQ